METQQLVAWQKQLNDYEIKQPVTQLELETGELEETLLDKTVLAFEGHKKVYAASFKALMKDLGFELLYGEYGLCIGSRFVSYLDSIEIVVELEEDVDFSDYTQQISLEESKFIRDNESLRLRSVPKRLISLCLCLQKEIEKKTTEVG